jgi:hypothetical protein
MDSLKRPLLLAIFISLALVPVFSEKKESWKGPFKRWSQKQAVTLLTDSPWCKEFTLARWTGRNRLPSEGISRESEDYLPQNTDIPGERDLIHTYTVRLFSALPVREAHVRLLQLGNNYDGMTVEQQAQFDRMTRRALDLDVSDQIIVALEFESNDRQLQMEVNKQLRDLGKEQLKQRVFLITENFERIDLREYYPPAPDGTGAKFVYPRKINNEPVVSTQDRELKFEFLVPGTEHKLYIVWNLDDLEYGGALAF